MSALAELQRRFLAGVLADDHEAAGDIRDTAAFTRPQRLRVYSNAYRRRLVDALASNLERCAAHLGEHAFEDAALAYIDANPPSDRSLGRYGLDFPDHLERRGDALAAGIARIDRGLRSAFDAADADALTREPLMALDAAAWATLRVRFAPAVSTATVSPAAIARWQALDPSTEHVAAAGDAASPDVEALALRVDVVFWRSDGQTRFRSLAPDEATLFARLHRGEAVAEALDDEVAPPLPRAAALLLGWIDDGWVAGIRTDAA